MFKHKETVWLALSLLVLTPGLALAHGPYGALTYGPFIAGPIFLILNGWLKSLFLGKERSWFLRLGIGAGATVLEIALVILCLVLGGLFPKNIGLSWGVIFYGAFGLAIILDALLNIGLLKLVKAQRLRLGLVMTAISVAVFCLAVLAGLFGGEWLSQLPGFSV